VWDSGGCSVILEQPLIHHDRPNHLAATLRRLPLFNDLSDEELTIIAERVTLRRYDSDAIIFSEGDTCVELLIVKEGALRSSKPQPTDAGN